MRIGWGSSESVVQPSDRAPLVLHSAVTAFPFPPTGGAGPIIDELGFAPTQLIVDIRRVDNSEDTATGEVFLAALVDDGTGADWVRVDKVDLGVDVAIPRQVRVEPSPYWQQLALVAENWIPLGTVNVTVLFEDVPL